MKKTLYIVALLFVSSLFSACSNLTIGFEEDSIFYTQPKSQKEVVLEEKNLATQVKPTDSQASQSTVSLPKVKQKNIHEKEIASPVVLEKKDEDSENETTFSYDPYSGE